MINLVIKGIQNIEGMKFHDIEGGFGEGKKAMLVKEIANIHGRELRLINEAINNNRKRFVDKVDIIDLKRTEFAIDLVDSEIYTRNSINASKNIYLLSERGYAKLLKVLEDDVAWEQYDKLVDGYFQMREERKSKSIITMENIDATALVTNIMNTTLQLMENNNKAIEKRIEEVEISAKNIITEQEIKHDQRINEITKLIGMKSKNVMSFTRLLKTKISDLKGYAIKADDYHYILAKERILRKFDVFKWEDLPIELYNSVHSLIDSIEGIEEIIEIQ